MLVTGFGHSNSNASVKEANTLLLRHGADAGDCGGACDGRDLFLPGRVRGEGDLVIVACCRGAADGFDAVAPESAQGGGARNGFRVQGDADAGGCSEMAKVSDQAV